MLVGGVSGIELGFVYAKSVYSKFAGGELPIYNVTAWKYGFSTASKIVSKEACQSYVLKYVVKGGVDPRFFRKQRYTCSTNLVRPETINYKEVCNSFDVYDFEEKNDYELLFADFNHAFYKFNVPNFRIGNTNQTMRKTLLLRIERIKNACRGRIVQFLTIF